MESKALKHLPLASATKGMREGDVMIGLDFRSPLTAKVARSVSEQVEYLKQSP